MTSMWMAMAGRVGKALDGSGLVETESLAVSVDEEDGGGMQ